MTGNPSLLSKSIPAPKWLTRFWGTGFESIPRVGAMVGLIEGISIARYDILMDGFNFSLLLRSIAFVCANTLLSVAVWSLLGWAVRRFTVQPGRVFRYVFVFWALGVAGGRELLGDRSVPLGDVLWWSGLAIVFLLPLESEGRFGRPLARCGEVVAAVLVTGCSLLGRVPDYSFAQYHTWFFLGSSTTIALVVYAAAIRTQLFLAVTTGLVLATGAISISPLSAGDKPNVLFILVDTLRRDHVGPYGNKVQTPAIVKLASEAVTFKNAVTVIPKTTASVSAIFTGRYPIHNGVRTLYDRLPDQQPTLAESFYADGYQTAAFVNNAWLSRGRGFSQGFEHYYGYYEIADTYGSFRYNSWVTLLDGLTVKNTEGFSGQTSSARLTDAALRYIEKNRDQPFLAYVHYFEPHWPYFPPNELAARYGAPADGRSLVNFIEQAGLERGLMIFQNSLPEEDNEAARRLYRAEVDNTLGQVGRLIAGLDDLGLSEDTIVVFTADHGHSLGEHDYFFHHGEFLYETSLQIPMIVRWPEKLPAGTIIEQQAQSIDLAPTLYALADIETHFQMDGQNLTRYIADPKAKAADAFLESDVKMFAANLRRGLTGISGKIRALRTDRHKLILNPTHQGAVFELYDLERDPGETTDLATDPSYAPLLLTLQERLLAQIPAHEGGMLVKMGSSIEPTAQPDQNEIEMLRKLGYIE